MQDIIPKEINDRLIYFQNETKNHFSFLSEYGYNLDKIETDQSNFLAYYSRLFFKNTDTTLSFSLETDIIKGHSTKFPKEKKKPIIDSHISCYISNSEAFMSLGDFCKIKHPLVDQDYFSIKLSATDINSEITRVILNYRDFILNNLVEVLKKEKMYDCYTDRFFDKVFKEINYINK